MPSAVRVTVEPIEIGSVWIVPYPISSRVVCGTVKMSLATEAARAVVPADAFGVVLCVSPMTTSPTRRTTTRATIPPVQ